jgi:16S rRNA (uracil1498-N3)-methyltransferase
MEFYYTPKNNIKEDSLIITGPEAKHISKVLRKKLGDKLFITDGEGSLYEIAINKVLKTDIECSILNTTQPKTEPEIKVTLFQSLLKNPSRFEFAIEKAVELGVYCIVPLITEHVINKSSNKLARWQSVSLSAMKQSQRCYLPKVNEPVFFDDALNMNYNIKLIAHYEAGSVNDFSFKDNINKSIAIYVGPEGGFSVNEISYAKEKQCKIITIGNRKFRSETTGLVLLSKLMY